MLINWRGLHVKIELLLYNNKMRKLVQHIAPIMKVVCYDKQR